MAPNCVCREFSLRIGRDTVEYDPRDKLWERVFETWYDTYFEENVSDQLIARWGRLDAATRVIVAVTASGSAVGGLALWTWPVGRVIWLIIASAAAILAVVHSSLSVPERLKSLCDIRALHVSLRIDLEMLRHRMEIDPDFPLAEFDQRFSDLRERYGQAVQTIRRDPLETNRLRICVQDQLNRRIRGMIIEEKTSGPEERTQIDSIRATHAGTPAEA